MSFLDRRLIDSNARGRMARLPTVAAFGLTFAILLFVAPLSVNMNKAEAAEQRGFVAALLCEWFSLGCAPDLVASENPTRPIVPVADLPEPEFATAPHPSASATPAVIHQTTNPIVERVVERIVSPAPVASEGISEALLNTRLNEFETAIASRFLSNPARTITSLYETVGAMGRIEHLGDLDLTNPTITGGSISGSSVNASSLTVSGTATSTFLGTVSIGTASGIAPLTVSGTAPRIIATVEGAVGNTGGWISVAGNNVFMADSANWGDTNSFLVFDVSNPSAPTQIANITPSYTFPAGSAVQGRYAYVPALNSSSLTVIDISNPSTPTQVGHLSSGLITGANAVFVQGKYAYIGPKSGNFVVVDISNPSSPSIAGHASVGHGLVSANINPFIQGTYAYVADTYNGHFLIFDVSNPSSPTMVSDTAANAAASGIQVQGRYAYIARNDSIAIYDVSDPSAPTLTGSIPYSGAFQVQGRFAYVASGSSIIVYDLSVPATPREISRITDSSISSVWVMRVQGRYAYITSGTTGKFSIIDLGGAVLQQVEAGLLDAGSLLIRNNLDGSDASFRGGVTVGQSLNVTGTGSFSATSSTAQLFPVLKVTNATGTAPIFTVLYNGNVGIATTSPWRTLSITGTVGFDGLTGATGAGSLCLTANKEVVYNSGSDACLPSLRATKHDITALTIAGTTTLAALDPVSFIYNADPSSTVRYGFIADDSITVDPHFGTYDAHGNLSGIDDRSILAVIVKAMQELISQVTGFADSFTTRELTFTRAEGDYVTARKLLCVADVCVTRDQLAAILSATGQTTAPAAPATPPAEPPAPEITNIPDVPPEETPPLVPDEPAPTPSPDPAPSTLPSDVQ